jgi:hypothetical protein
MMLAEHRLTEVTREFTWRYVGQFMSFDMFL